MEAQQLLEGHTADAHREGLSPADYRSALYSQDACNGGALIRAMGRIIPKVQEQVRQDGGGTDDVNEHPIVVLFTAQLMHLSGLGVADTTKWSRAYDACHAAAGK